MEYDFVCFNASHFYDSWNHEMCIRDRVYDIDGVSLSMPAIVGADGIESDIPINLSGEEALKLKESADSLKKIIETIEL